MPQRPRSHVLADESSVAFQQAIGDNLLFRETTKGDYGLDGEVEIFEADGLATGIKFGVQLKSTDEPVLSKALKERIKLTTANYWRSQNSPTLVVKYHSPTKSIFAKWFHQFDPYYDHVGDTHLTFRWGEEDQWSEDSPAKFASEAGQVMKAKSAAFQPPVTLRLEIESLMVQGVGRTELAVAFEAAAAELPDLLTLTDDDEAMLRLTVSDNEVVANFAGIASSHFHFEDEEPQTRSESEIVADLFMNSALSLARVGHSDLASRLALPHAKNSLIAVIPPISVELAMALAKTRRVSEAIDLAERFIDAAHDETEGGALAYLFTLVDQPVRLEDQQVERISRLLESQYEIALEQDVKLSAALALLHGSLMVKVNDPGGAAEWFSKARVADPDLNQDPGFLARLAGTRFLSGSFAESAEIYDQAIALTYGDAPDLAARRADALMLMGKYESALAEFNDIVTDDTELSAWIYVKSRALHFVASWCEVKEQDRKPDQAVRRSKDLMDESLTDDEVDDIMEEIIDADAISFFGWFNYGVNMTRLGEDELAKHAYLVCSVIHEGDAEAWVNVAILAMNTEDEDLLATSVLTGSRLNAQTYFEEFSRQLKVHRLPPEGREEFLAMVRKLADPRSYEGDPEATEDAGLSDHQ